MRAADGRAKALRHRSTAKAKALPHRTTGKAEVLRYPYGGGTALPPPRAEARYGETRRSLGEGGQRCPADPFALFRRWFRDAEKAGEPLPEAMALATAARGGPPSVRVVLNRGTSRGGLVFYTNYDSRKATELVDNPHAAVVFHWPKLERQLRVEGRVHKLTRRESDRYFQTRPRDSRVSAWASPQSAEIASRSFLEAEFARVQARFGDRRIPCPPFWGGFRLVANCIEFWQGQPHRLHDRVLYRRKGKTWTILRLAP